MLTHPPPPAPRDSVRVFQKLSEIFSDENNYSLSRELLVKVRWAGPLSGRLFADFRACLVWTLGGGGPGRVQSPASVCPSYSVLWAGGDGVVVGIPSLPSPACPLGRPCHPLPSELTSQGRARACPGVRSQRGCPGVGPND